jgi:hypothetical protein
MPAFATGGMLRIDEPEAKPAPQPIARNQKGTDTVRADAS